MTLEVIFRIENETDRVGISFLGASLTGNSGTRKIPTSVRQRKTSSILNEGNFQWGNASLSFYKYSDESITSDVFSDANDRPLGDVGQSLCIYDNKLFIVVNNSGKVEVVNPDDCKSIATISGLTSPRYFLGINSSKAYVSDMGAGSVSVVDLNNYSKTTSIKCNGSTEEMILHNDKVYVSNTTKEYII